MTLPGWTAVIVNYNGAAYLEACLLALQRTQVAPTDTVVVDNASDDDSVIELHAFPRVQLLQQQRNLGFAGGANVGLAAVETEIAVVFNPDVEVATDFGSAVLNAFASEPTLGAAGALLRFPDHERIQHAGGAIDRPLMTTRHLGYGESDPSSFAVPVDVDYVTGGAMGLRVDAVRAIGGFDTAFSPVYYEDADLCLRLAQAGWRVQLIPTMQAVHHEGVTLQYSATYYRHIHRNRIRFALKHLSAEEWKYGFVPAELHRLRHELHTATGDDALTISGVDAIEAVLRGIDEDAGWDGQPIVPVWPARVGHIDLASELVEVAGRPPHSKNPLVRWVRSFVNDLGTRWYVDPALEQQRQFNAEVVRALDAHDHMHREQTAALLLVALDALGRLKTLTKTSSAPTE